MSMAERQVIVYSLFNFKSIRSFALASAYVERVAASMGRRVLGLPDWSQRVYYDGSVLTASPMGAMLLRTLQSVQGVGLFDVGGVCPGAPADVTAGLRFLALLDPGVERVLFAADDLEAPLLSVSPNVWLAEAQKSGRIVHVDGAGTNFHGRPQMQILI